MGKQWKQCQTLFWGAPKSLQMVTAAMKLKDLLLGRKVMTNLDSILKSRDITLPTKVHLVKAMVFPVVMYGYESWLWRKLSTEELMLLNCGVGEDSWESPLNCKEIQLVHPKGDHSWLFIGRTYAKAETPILTTWCEELTHWKDSNASKDWRWEEKERTYDEMAGWHHQLNGHEFD